MSDSKLDSKRLRWGILGCADIARKHVAPALRAADSAQLLAVASRDARRAAAFAEEHGADRAYGSYQELLADPEVDAVYVPLPIDMHATWSIRALEAGKAVLCEKPLAASSSDARAILEASRRTGRPCAEAFMYRFHPLTREVLRRVRAGALGEIKTARAHFNTTLSPGQNIRWQRERGGGAMLDLGCYCVSFLRLVLGQEPIEASAFVQWTGPGGVDESMAGLLRFPGGALGSFSCCLSSPFDCSYDIGGSKARLSVDFGGLVAWPGGQFTLKQYANDECVETVIGPADHYQLMVESFCEAVLEGRPLEPALEESVANLEVVERLFAAAGPPP